MYVTENGSISEMFFKATRLADGKTLHRFKAKQIPRFKEGQHAQHMDFLLNRGGYSAQEIRTAFDESGIELVAADISMFQETWQEEASEKLDDSMLTLFTQQNTEYESQRENLLCANRYSSQFPWITVGSSFKIRSVKEHAQSAR